MTKKLTVVQMLPELESGGVERGTLEIGKYLVDHGHRSIVISGGGQMVEQLIREGSEHINWEVGKKSLLTLRYIKKVRKFLQETKPDILHLRSRLPAWIGYLAWKKLPKSTRPKLVTTVHGRYSVSKYSEIMMRGEKIIAVSNVIRDYILDNYPQVDADDIEVIHRGVDRDQYIYGYRPNKAWQKTWYGQFPQMEKKLLLTLPGRLTRLKGHEDFISVIDILIKSGQNIHGVIVGGAHPKKKRYEEEMNKKVTELGLGSHITFVGQRNDMKEILAISTIVFSLSEIPESFGRTTLEALSIGNPVIGYAHGGVDEQLLHIFPQGLVPVGSTDCVLEKVNSWLAKLPQLPIEHQFTLDNMCQATLDVYQNC
jgi:glycosyltransferase involved in cell wall biosynthesis